MNIPHWNTSGVIPSIRPGVSGHDRDRSPYLATLVEFIEFFCFSQERVNIAEGFLTYRAKLHAIGFHDGFQWLNGSFSENIELNEARSPNDIDVVTFFHPPAGADLASIAESNIDLFDSQLAKAKYRVDGYFSQLGLPQRENEVKLVSYWYSIWSHRRDGLWKGFVQVPLDPRQDDDATARLKEIGEYWTNHD